MITVDMTNAENVEASNHLYQWDKEQEIEITGLEVSAAPEIHVGVKGSGLALVVNSTLSGGTVTATVPNHLLMSGKDITAYVHIADTTIKSVHIPVFRRNMPENYVVDPEPADWIEELKGQVIKNTQDIATLNEGGLNLKDEIIGEAVTNWLNAQESNITTDDVNNLFKGE